MGELIVFCPAPGKSMEDSLKVANVSNKVAMKIVETEKLP